MSNRFSLHTVTGHRSINPWQFLSCVFDPGWHENDEDEMVPSLALTWLNEHEATYRVELRRNPLDHLGDLAMDHDDIEFEVIIEDQHQAAMFRLMFPTLQPV